LLVQRMKISAGVRVGGDKEKGKNNRRGRHRQCVGKKCPDAWGPNTGQKKTGGGRVQTHWAGGEWRDKGNWGEGRFQKTKNGVFWNQSPRVRWRGTKKKPKKKVGREKGINIGRCMMRCVYDGPHGEKVNWKKHTCQVKKKGTPKTNKYKSL